MEHWRRGVGRFALDDVNALPSVGDVAANTLDPCMLASRREVRMEDYRKSALEIAYEVVVCGITDVDVQVIRHPVDGPQKKSQSSRAGDYGVVEPKEARKRTDAMGEEWSKQQHHAKPKFMSDSCTEALICTSQRKEGHGIAFREDVCPRVQIYV